MLDFPGHVRPSGGWVVAKVERVLRVPLRLETGTGPVASDGVSAQKEAPDVRLERLVAPETIAARAAEVEYHLARLVGLQNGKPTDVGRSV